MTSYARPSFWRAYAALDPRTKLAARRAFGLFVKSPEHPSLRFKKLQGHDSVWSVRINEQYRAIGERDENNIHWIWIGSHNEFDSKFG